MDKPKQAELTRTSPARIVAHLNATYPDVIKPSGKQKLQHILGPSSDINISNQQETNVGRT